MAQQALRDAQARVNQLQKQQGEAFSAWRANQGSDLEKECYEDLKISLHKAEDAVNSLAAAAASTLRWAFLMCFYCDKQLCTPLLTSNLAYTRMHKVALSLYVLAYLCFIMLHSIP